MQQHVFFSKQQRFTKSMLMVTIISGWFILSGLLPLPAMSQGNLLIMPRRVVFEGDMRSQELVLANTGTDTSKFVISIVQYRMKEDGSFEQITQPDPGQLFADAYLRFFPRSVNLGPNESQIVKVQLTKTDNLEPGEYRSHIYFRAEPKETPLGEEEAPVDTTTLTVRLTPVFGITIPAIIRVGESTTKVNLSDFALEMVNDTVPQLNFSFNRSGNMSVYGDVRVDYVSSKGVTTQVAAVKGLAVYTPNPVRRFQTNLMTGPEIDYRKGKLVITYETQSDETPVRLAEAEVALK
jgi:hypothetical protein